ncbi:MFS transporter [Paracoccus caeni]|uniref:MFS transporter n=1 Tax=Paracoccus caeni TaxID=657651 RepID=A0A934VUA2_9RHOB|nr:MFS transporter [Paracoccus caeni]MBK4215596.1 MFS transporter [Paracoccus caeni]
MAGMIETGNSAGGYADAGKAQGSWRDLLAAPHLAVVTVLSGGVLLYAMNLYFTAALMPTIVSDIGGQEYYAWVTTAFVVAAIAASLFVSRMLQRLGTAKTYILASVIFAIGALASAFSTKMEFLVLVRIVQGIGGGLLAGLAYAVIRSMLPSPLWALATGTVSAMWGIGTLLGPVLGGLFAEFQLWRAAYASLAVASVVLAVIAYRALKDDAGTVADSPLPFGSLIIVFAAILAISLGSVLPMGWPIIATLLVGLGLFWVFIAIERKSDNTILPGITYQKGNKLKWIYLTIAALSAGVMVENFIPLFGQKLAGLSPLWAGLLGTVLSFAWVVAQFFTLSIQSEAKRARVIRTGPVILTAGLIAYGLTQHADAGPIVIAIWVAALALAGAGIGMAWPLLGVAVMNSTDDPKEGGRAAAAISTIQLLAFSFASAISGTLMATGGSSLERSAAYVILGTAAMTAIGLFSAVSATRKS